MSGTGGRATGAFPAGALAGYGLFADAAFPVKAVPAGYSLFADVAVPAGAMPPDFALAVDKHAVTAAPRPRRTAYAAIGAALALHLAVILFFAVRPGAPKRLGIEEGLPDTLNVSVISEADLKRLIADPFRQDGHPSPAPASEAQASAAQAQPVPEPQHPAVQEANAAASLLPPKASERRDTAFDPEGFIALASQQFSAQLDHAFKAAEPRRETAQRAAMAANNVKVLRPGASHAGKSDEFARAVIWALGATKPMGNGKWGTTIVTFVISAAGRVEGLSLLKSAGDNWLDTSALMAVRQARMPMPPGGLPPGDRTFNVEYISLPGR